MFLEQVGFGSFGEVRWKGPGLAFVIQAHPLGAILMPSGLELLCLKACSGLKMVCLVSAMSRTAHDVKVDYEYKSDQDSRKIMPPEQDMLNLALEEKEETGVKFEIKMHGSISESKPIMLGVDVCASRALPETVVGVCCITQDDHKMIMDKLWRIEDYKAILHKPKPLISPIFGTDEIVWGSEWNQAMAKLSGIPREQVIDKMLLRELIGTNAASCCLTHQESFISLNIVLHKDLTSQEAVRNSFRCFDKCEKYVDCWFCASKRVDNEGTIIGLLCVLQITTKDLQQTIPFQRMSEKIAAKRLEALAYVKRKIKKSLAASIFLRKLMEATKLSDEQKELLHTSVLCRRQLHKVLDNTDLNSIVEGYLNLEMIEFTLQQILGASISQVMAKSDIMKIEVVNNVPEGMLVEKLYGDGLRLQQVLADFLSLSVSSTQTTLLIMTAKLSKNVLAKSVLMKLELRIIQRRWVPKELFIKVSFSEFNFEDKIF